MSEDDGTYDWTEQSKGGNYATRIPETARGEAIPLTILKIIYGDRQGVVYKSKNGDPQIMIVVTDERGNEASEMITLSPKAAFKLRDILQASGANTATMNARGITPAHFADAQFADAQLKGRRFNAEVFYETEQEARKGYARITPHRPQPGASQSGVSRHAAPAPQQRQAAPPPPPPPPQRQSTPPRQQRQSQPAGASANGGGGFNPESNKGDDIPF